MRVHEAAALIQRGEIVAFPTETVYGLGAEACNPEAVQKIFKVKGRPADNPLIIHLADPKQVADFALEIPKPARKLMAKCWPGPLTLIFKKRPEVPDAATAGLLTVALRIPDHPVALELLRQTGPLAAPSANRSGSPSPTKAEHVRRDLGSDFPVLDGGMSKIGLESTVLDVSETPFTILRPGKYTVSYLREISGVKIETLQKTTGKPKSPGIQYTHYKPKATVQWYDSTELDIDKNQTLLITHTRNPEGFPNHIHMKGDYEKFARELYDLFRTADYQSFSHILIEPLPENPIHPLLDALQNRIEKAAGQPQPHNKKEDRNLK